MLTENEMRYLQYLRSSSVKYRMAVISTTVPILIALGIGYLHVSAKWASVEGKSIGDILVSLMHGINPNTTYPGTTLLSEYTILMAMLLFAMAILDCIAIVGVYKLTKTMLSLLSRLERSGA
jgi:hypothetical protein